ncbi:MAG: hypothetical protein IJV30_10250 [Oscillospiraceae bacterium]|nr:hypothetical protein [Oscillospiraceae bacterium]
MALCNHMNRDREEHAMKRLPTEIMGKGIHESCRLNATGAEKEFDPAPGREGNPS